jgi:hypothetical protein
MLLTVGSPSRPGLGMGSRAINYSWEGQMLETIGNFSQFAIKVLTGYAL